MNAYTEIAPEANVEPAITVRDRRFGRDSAQRRWWAGGDPVATAWLNALSATFPRGETLFIDAVKAFRDDAPPRLAGEIRAFVKQEVNHTREHLAFNRAAEAAGYDFTAIDARVAKLLDEIYAAPPHVWLGVTIALEHFTAMFAHEFLSHPQHFTGSDTEQAELWRWHAVEEIEHKGVAFDTWLHATRGWSRWKRWKVKSLLMLVIARRFVVHRFKDTIELLVQDGISGWRARMRLLWYLVGTPGVLRRIFPAWCAYFLPGFHPWRLDDRALIGKYDSDYAAAVMG
ncbi:MAG TPA: metal-dependent hydrolase [Croceibacterium sp.]|nr:metal-dependent hydrolase [Croceibacterium sp.]